MFRRCLLLSLLGLAGCSSLPVAAIGDPETSATDLTWNSIEDDLTTLMDAYRAPSLAVAVIKDGDIVFARSFGFRNIDQKLAASRESQYAIGSIVKPFTSALIGSLESQGLLSLSDHPSRHLEELIFSDSDLNENLTIANLLSQTSGLPDISGSLAFFPEPDQRDLLPRLTHFSASCRVGDCWQYNNLNFVILDAIAESVTGRSKSELLLERQLRPTGMDRSVSATDAFESSAHAAVGYALVDGTHVRTATEYLFGEQVYATASDLAVWLDTWMTSDVNAAWTDYAKRAISMQAISDGSPPNADEPSVYLFGYGYGWRIKSVEGHYVVEHGGNENGFSAQVLFVPAERIGVVALTNQQGSLLPYMANDIMLRSTLSLPGRDSGEYPVQVTSATALVEPEEKGPTIHPENPPSLALDAITGRYEAVGYGSVRVEYTGDALSLVTPAATFILQHRFGDTYGLASSEPVPAGVVLDFFEITFSKDSLSTNFAREPVVFSRSAEPERN